MPTKYKQLTEGCCAQHGISIPAGFARHTPSRYVIIRTDIMPPKLIATTWFKTEDVHYYIEHFLHPELGDALPPATLSQQQRWFDRFCDQYNCLRPHEGIDLQTPASLYVPSSRPLPAVPPPLVYPAHFERRLVSKNSGIRWRDTWVAVSTTVAGLQVGLEEIDHGLWDVYLGPVKLGRLLEETMRIEDHLGRLNRINKKQ
jgi:hypothetical protein